MSKVEKGDFDKQSYKMPDIKVKSSIDRIREYLLTLKR